MNLANFRPLPGKIIVKQARTQLSSFISVPESLLDKEDHGIVVKSSEENSLKVGDRVLFGTFSGNTIEFDNEDGNETEYLYLEEKDLIGAYI